MSTPDNPVLGTGSSQLAPSGSHRPPLDQRPLLQVENLRMYFPITTGLMRRKVGEIRAVEDVNITIYKGETLSLVGESGCGKTTVGRCILRVYKPTSGRILYRREDDDTPVDLAALDNQALQPYRQEIRMVFQNPFAALNPRLTVRDIIAEPLEVNGVAKGPELEERVIELLRKVGLAPEHAVRYPHAFSGGQRQRIVIARALALNPRLVVADEAVSALDVSVRAQIINLLADLQDEYDLTYLFISHDLSVVEHLSDRVAVMYVGQLVEIAPTEALYLRPLHPYTEALLSAVPLPDPRRRLQRQRIVLQGEVPDPADPPPGCRFHPRCRYATERCQQEAPALREVEQGRFVACHFAEELELKGAYDGVETA